MQDIALMGLAGAGKDTVGAHLVRTYGYVRTAFADEVRRHALRVDPLVHTGPGEPVERLSHVVECCGWESAKRRFPDVRRTLQHLGQAVRDVDEEWWVTRWRETYDAVPEPAAVVVTDVRYPNEVNTLRDEGFYLVYIHRTSLTPDTSHVSERAVGPAFADRVFSNDGSVQDLHAKIDALLGRLSSTS